MPRAKNQYERNINAANRLLDKVAAAGGDVLNSTILNLELFYDRYGVDISKMKTLRFSTSKQLTEEERRQLESIAVGFIAAYRDDYGEVDKGYKTWKKTHPGKSYNDYIENIDSLTRARSTMSEAYQILGSKEIERLYTVKKKMKMSQKSFEKIINDKVKTAGQRGWSDEKTRVAVEKALASYGRKLEKGRKRR